MAKFVIAPHMRLHEWVAEEKGYFADEGLDYDYRREFPERFHARMDTRRWGPGERLVFEPYTKEAFDESFRWIAAHGIFPEGQTGSGLYDRSVVSVAR